MIKIQKCINRQDGDTKTLIILLSTFYNAVKVSYQFIRKFIIAFITVFLLPTSVMHSNGNPIENTL